LPFFGYSQHRPGPKTLVFVLGKQKSDRDKGRDMVWTINPHGEKVIRAKGKRHGSDRKPTL
jgi:hypothetical protein